MAIEYTIRAVCDKCGGEIRPAKSTTVKSALETIRWCWKREWQREGVMQGLPNMAGKFKLYCARCAGS